MTVFTMKRRIILFLLFIYSNRICNSTDEHLVILNDISEEGREKEICKRRLKIRVCMYICMHICMYVCMYVCVCVCVCELCCLFDVCSTVYRNIFL